MYFNVISEKDSTPTTRNLKLTGYSEIETHFSRKKASLTKQEHKIRPSLENFEDWPDIVFRYYEDTYNFAVYFIKATPGVVYDCINATDDILVSYTRDDKIVSIDIDGISKTLQCHMFDVMEVIDEKPPLTLKPIYYEDSDTLKIYFTDHTFMSTLNNPVETDIEDIKVERDNMGRIICILFCNAKKRIAKPIPEEEREKLARICKEEADELSKKYVRS